MVYVSNDGKRNFVIGQKLNSSAAAGRTDLVAIARPKYYA
jgi:hypothetical protein